MPRAGADLAYEVYDRDAPTVLLAPTWELVDSRMWKAQVPYLSRHFRVVIYDAAGTGRSSKPRDTGRYTQMNRMHDAVAVLDATGTDRAGVLGYSAGGTLGLLLATFHPERVDGVVALAAGHPRNPDPEGRLAPPWDPDGEEPPVGWSKFNHDWWQRNFRDFVEWFIPTINSDPHATKLQEDGIAWALEMGPEAAWSAITDCWDLDVDDWYARLASCQVPTLLIHGDKDTNTNHAGSVYLSDLMPAARLHTVEGADHPVLARYPILFNHLAHDFLNEAWDLGPRVPSTPLGEAATTAYAAPASAPKRVLYLSSPIGLGHARRDVVIAEELRAAHPDVVVDWLAEHPVTRVLEEAGERIHPASRLLGSEAAIIDAACDDHTLNVLDAARQMDAVQVHNFHILDEVLTAERYDLVVADEAWQLDNHLFENPHLKRAPIAWMTDFIGDYGMPSGGEWQAKVARDLNTQMVEHIATYPDLRDVSVFVGGPDDVPTDPLAPGLPTMRDWTREHFDFSGYITGFDPRALGDRERLRAQVGFDPREKVCLVCVGGSGAGTSLIRRVVTAAPAARRVLPELRMIVVTGPCIDPSTMPQVPGVEYHAYVHGLYRWLAACDLAVVQGGLTTTMELTAAKVPFIYVPLREHFEQNHHVAARLRRYRAGRRMDYDELDPGALAQALLDLLSTPVDYAEVETDGAAKAAALIGAAL
ncbi:alpha/beta fold hydrolase [Demequina zhanjiangensis]|uniref:Alpha/beta fold hydrolase n=1 Tax=Demequina zhanjiangensis TaxID=3051659 RepID=A0ABT8G365_9MICO|nr:alpha/beta hydrolase [Demequina sp. SYSU T00b26]MDN4473452.1 alpha/beta fold hydrolase [Demequina sp. SYSU T00b26]